MFALFILSKMPRPAKKTEATPVVTLESVISDAKKIMEQEKTSAPAPQPKQRVPRQHKAVPSTASAPVKAEKPVKIVKAEKAEKAPKPVKEVATPAEGAEPSKRKTFKPLTAELKEKLAEHAKTEGITKSHILSMKSHLMLGKSFEEAHQSALAKAQKKAEASQ